MVTSLSFQHRYRLNTSFNTHAVLCTSSYLVGKPIPVTDVAGWGSSGADKRVRFNLFLSYRSLRAMSGPESRQGTIARVTIPAEIWLEIMRSATDLPDSLEHPQLRHINEGTCLSGLAIERCQTAIVGLFSNFTLEDLF